MPWLLRKSFSGTPALRHEAMGNDHSADMRIVEYVNSEGQLLAYGDVS